MISSNQVFTKNNKLIVGELPSTTYNVMDVDDILNVNTSIAPVDIYLPNIKNSSILIQNRVIYINDVGGSASINNIRIYTTGSNLVNLSNVLIVNQNGANVMFQASNNSEWLATGVPITTYKVYTALLSQAGKRNPPTAKILENTIGNIVWTHYDAGVYRATLVGAFPNEDKFFTLNHKNMVDAQKFIAVKWNNSDSFEVRTSVVGYFPSIAYTPEDSLLSNYPIEIRVYS